MKRARKALARNLAVVFAMILLILGMLGVRARAPERHAAVTGTVYSADSAAIPDSNVSELPAQF